MLMIAGCISAKPLGDFEEQHLLLRGSGVNVAFLSVTRQGRVRGRKLESGALFLLEFSVGVAILSKVYSILGNIKHKIGN